MKTVVAAVAVACAMTLGGCAGVPGVSLGNMDRSAERQAEDRCRMDARSGGGGAADTAAYHACMAKFRRPERDD